MPSPFPGMDPWLEGSEIFPDLHDSLIGRLRDALNEILPPSYFATIASRIVIDDPRQEFEPDVDLFSREPPPKDTPQFSGNGGVAVATKPVVIVAGDDVRQKFLEIRAGPDGGRLVTVIEVLSPSNKRLGEHNRDPYVQKQRNLLSQRVHVVEIDLLRRGEHSTMVPIDLFTVWVDNPEYHVCVSRFDCPRDYHVYPIRLVDRLPNIAFPLLPGVAEAVVGLQPILDRCYDSGRYASRINYRQPPDPPLTVEQSAWAEQLLAKRSSP